MKNRCYIQLPDIDYGNGFQFPPLRNHLFEIPEKFYRWGTQRDKPFHCFVDDWRIESIWRNKYKFADRVLSSRYAVLPDYTVHDNAPPAWAFHQVWRSRVIGACWANHGVTVIPVLQWSLPYMNHILFDGLSQCEVIAVRSPTRGSESEWQQCAEQFLQIHQPKLMLHFGTKRGIEVWGDNVINLNLR